MRVLPDLPPLGWLAEASASTLQLWCGSQVEVRDAGFFEGCWPGDFARFDFDQSAEVFGSGARIWADQVVFVPPSHTLEGLYALERGSKVTVSNSLAFLVQFEGLELGFDFEIGRRFASILNGITDYQRVLFTGESWKLSRIFHEHATLGKGRLILQPQPRRESPFADFQGYKSYLLATLEKTFENAESPLRKTRFSPIATCSSGYDSPACAALAASLGCDEALALTTARGGKADSGRTIAEQLGMTVHEFERDAKSQDRSFGEAEFLSSGMGGEDYVLGALSPVCAGRLVVNGFLGGTMWQVDYPPTTTLVRKDCSGSSLTENRLRHGFVLLPVPFIGAIHHDRILQISRSAEMEKFRVGGDYDRPIPRRILEELGVPRQSFGSNKKGYSICFNYSSLWWSSTSLRDLKQFERRTLAHRRMGRYLLRRALHSAVVSGYYLALKLSRSVRASRLPRSLMKRLKPDFPVYEHNHPRYGGIAFLWSLDKVKARYPQRETVLTPAASPAPQPSGARPAPSASGARAG